MEAVFIRNWDRKIIELFNSPFLKEIGYLLRMGNGEEESDRKSASAQSYLGDLREVQQQITPS